MGNVAVTASKAASPLGTVIRSYFREPLSVAPKGFDKSDRKRLKMCIFTFSLQVDKEIQIWDFQTSEKDILFQVWSPVGLPGQFRLSFSKTSQLIINPLS